MENVMINTELQWYSVDEKLPTQGIWVLAMFNNRGFQILSYGNDLFVPDKPFWMNQKFQRAEWHAASDEFQSVYVTHWAEVTLPKGMRNE